METLLHFGPYALAAGILFVVATLFAISFRIVVPTNSVHIVQRSGTTTSYGRGQPKGNVYWRFPSWLPFFGVRVTVLPVYNFDRKLIDYAAYDVDRVPFVIDVVGFFRISDSNVAAERVQSFAELEEQLEPILQGAARTILATSTIDEILGSRAVFSEKFTQEVTKDLTAWGVEPVKSIELMDIRDAQGSQVIAQIMAKKKSGIEMESRVAVAANQQKANVAEIEAKQTVALRSQEAEEQVGRRSAAKELAIGTAQANRDQQIGIAEQQAQQAVQEQAKTTAQRTMEVQNVNQVRSAEIERDRQIVAAEQQKQVAIRQAEGRKQAMMLDADGALAKATNEAKAVELNGTARASAETALALAPVTAQVTLAKEIGANEGYQKYLVEIRTVEASQSVGMEQAKALEKANIKIVATGADPASALNLVSLGNSIAAVIDTIRGKDDKKAA